MPFDMPFEIQVSKNSQVTFILLGVIITLTMMSVVFRSPPVEKSSFGWNRSAILDSELQFLVNWSICPDGKVITFEIQAKTEGWIGFGISPEGRMAGSDIVVGGIGSDGKAYFQDRYAEGNSEPKIDSRQDWKLLASSEKNGVTYLKFSRLLVTCDDKDVAITNDAMSFIWAVGSNDGFTYHGEERRGSYPLNILQPPQPQIDLSQYKTMELMTNVTLPPNETVYWCDLHRTPKIYQRNHIVSIGAKIQELGLRHTHSMTLWSCLQPDFGQNSNETTESFFEPFVHPGGQSCFNDPERGNPLPIYKYCQRIVYSWAMGATQLVMPEDIGLPLGEFGVVSNQYFLLEMHFENSGINKTQFETRVQIHYTKKLRPIEAGLLHINAVQDWRLTIPPNSTDFHTASHCHSSCTEHLESQGYTIFNVQLQSHRSTRMRLRHFRNGKELPWLGRDATSSNKFQSNRDILPQRKLFRRDQLTLECSYDTRWLNGKVAFGGHSPMCSSILFYYPVGRLYSCQSRTFPKNIMKRLGIQGFKNIGAPDPVIKTPEKYKDLKYSTFINGLNWTSDLSKHLQFEELIAPQKVICEIKGVFEMQPLKVKFPAAKFPKVDKPYKSSVNCSR